MRSVSRYALPSEPDFFFQAEDGIRDGTVTGVQTCGLPISGDSAGQQCGLGMILLANSARPKAVVNLPYCLTPPNVLPFVICPNSHTHVPLTLACVQNG